VVSQRMRHVAHSFTKRRELRGSAARTRHF
jgi:hypothetical protein